MSKPPEIANVVQLLEYNSNLLRAILGLHVAERKIRKLSNTEVLIRTDAVPCNPSDIAFIRGGYNLRKSLPAVPGFEGTGVVIDTGIRAVKFLGKRVSAFVQADDSGTWADYFIANAKDCILIRDDLDVEQAVCLAINPFTAWALVEIAESKNAGAIVQNASGGQVAAFIRSLASQKKITVIDIVRKPEHIDELKRNGSKYVLDSTSEKFTEELKQLTHQFDVNLAFDAAGGEMTGILLQCLPDHSEVVLYGGLAGGGIAGIDPFDIIFRNKKLIGFNLADWKKQKCQVDFNEISGNIQDMMMDGRLKTKIQAVFKFNDVLSALRTYIKSMSAGKILLVP
jgi:NADPH:quinone reductase